MPRDIWIKVLHLFYLFFYVSILILRKIPRQKSIINIFFQKAMHKVDTYVVNASIIFISFIARELILTVS